MGIPMTNLDPYQSIETSRAFWAEVAKEHGWYQEPFYVQVWLSPDGEVYDSVSTRRLTQDVIIQLTQEELEELIEID